MIEYNGYKIFEIDYGEQDYIVAKNAQEALNYFFECVGDEYDEDGFTVNVVKEDFFINQDDIGEESDYASNILKKDIDNGAEPPYTIACSVY